MHFSRPSGYRLSWCRPWNRGFTGAVSNGYCSVTVRLKKFLIVTPNPAAGASASATGLRFGISDSYGRTVAGRATSPPPPVRSTDLSGVSATRHLLGGGLGGVAVRALVARRGAADEGGRRGRLSLAPCGARGRRQALAGQRRHREAPGERVERLVRRRRLRRGLLLRDEERQRDDHEDRAAEPGQHRHDVRAAELADALDDRDADQPDQRRRDQHLPAELHELVVPEP